MTESPAHISLFAANLIYGANFSIAKIAMPQHISPAAFVLLRVLAATGLFFLLDRSTESRQKIERKKIMCGFWTWFCWRRHQSIAFSKVWAEHPTSTLLLSWLLHRSWWRWWHFYFWKSIWNWLQVTGIALGNGWSRDFDSAIPESHRQAGDHAFGDFMVLQNAASLRTLYRPGKTDDEKVWYLAGDQMDIFFGLLLVTPFGSPGLARVEWNNFTLSVWLAVGFVLLFTTFFAYLFNTYGLKHLSPSVVSFYIYLQPLFATLFVSLLIYELISLVQIVACVWIFAGVYLVNSPALGKTKS